MAVRTKKRLPGFRFETQPSALTQVLPRMDIAVFIGFAASGPLHTPVPVDNVPQFVEIFGEETPLAWDAERNAQQYAYLAPAVRAFFRNGGRRCWIIRVAAQQPTKKLLNNQAMANSFPVPGLAQLVGDQVQPVFVYARSEGSWSDGLRVSASLQSQPIEVIEVPMQSPPDHNTIIIELPIDAIKFVTQNDFLRLTFRKSGCQVMFAVNSIQAKEIAVSPPRQNSETIIEIMSGKSVWFKDSWAMQPPSLVGTAYTFTAEGKSEEITAFVVMQEPAEEDPTSPPGPVLDWPATPTDKLVKLDLQISLEHAPLPGALLKIVFNSDELLYIVQDVISLTEAGSPPGEMVRVTGEALWWLKDPPDIALSELPTAEKLSVDLWVRKGEANPVQLADLSLSQAHPRFIGSLPTDATLFGNLTLGSSWRVPDLWKKLDPADLSTHQNLWSEVSNPRFPLAGFSPQDGAIYFPIGMPIIPTSFVGPAPFQTDVTPLERDGLAEFSYRLFLDPDLIDSRIDNLIDQADFIRYTSLAPRKLYGIHAAIGIEEATLIAVPDAIHREWEQQYLPEAEDALPSQPLPHPEWWHFMDCSSSQATISTEKISSSEMNSDIELKLVQNEQLDETERFIISWSSVNVYNDANYVLEESVSSEFQNSKKIYFGKEPFLQMLNCKQGNLYYRVRMEAVNVQNEWLTSRWSNTVLAPLGIPLLSKPLTANFLSCSIQAVAPPALYKRQYEKSGMFSLFWSSVADSKYFLEESSYPDFSGAVVIYSGQAIQMDIYSRNSGDYYYRVRAAFNDTTTDWSNGVHVRVQADYSYRLVETVDYSNGTLLAVQRALLRICAARGDLFAVIALPEHLHANEAIDYVTKLKSSFNPTFAVISDGVQDQQQITSYPLSPHESRAFSHAAAYYPWIIAPMENQIDKLRNIPPDGIACGLLARRTLTRGAWIAPANELFQGIIGLTLSFTPESRENLQQAQINLLSQEPTGFTVVGAETLSDEVDLQPINVRRLLCLLRRLTLREGATYVFEPNSTVFRRTLQRGFESLLDYLFVRGAFAGPTPRTSYQVVIDSELNRPQSLDLGRLIVELRVAPALPMTFMTIRLMQTNDQRLIIEER